MRSRSGVHLFVAFLFLRPCPAQASDDTVPFRPFFEDGAAVFTAPFQKENRAYMLGAVAAVGGTVILLDDPIQDHLYPNRKEETPCSFRKAGDMLQFAGLAYGTVLGLKGVVADKAELRQEGVLSYETYIWSAAVLGSLKWLTGRQRPEQTDNPFHWIPEDHASSFPSGHTTQAFAAATLISEHYNKPSVTVPAYMAATSVGVSRALANKHWASDVVAGAVIGTAIAHLLRKRHNQRMKERAWRVEPDADGVRLVHEF